MGGVGTADLLRRLKSRGSSVIRGACDRLIYDIYIYICCIYIIPVTIFMYIYIYDID